MEITNTDLVKFKFRFQPLPQGLRAEKALASARILHHQICGVKKLRPLNFNARN